MPLTSKGERILAAMQEQYGAEKGKQVFYASKNAGRITGVDEDEEAEDMSRADWEALQKWIAEEMEEPEHGKDCPKAKDDGGKSKNGSCKEWEFVGNKAYCNRDQLVTVTGGGGGGGQYGGNGGGGASMPGADADRKNMPGDAFLLPDERKYPVKVPRNGGWIYSKDLLEAAQRRATTNGLRSVARRAEDIRLREFGDLGEAEDSLAFDDVVSSRTLDADGRLHVDQTNISKANICPYMGREIPGWRELGLDADKIYRLLRDPEELSKAAPTFNGVQLLRKHIPVDANDHRPYDTVGATGTDAVFEYPYLKNSLVVWAQPAIEDIQSGVKKQLSCAYYYRPDMTPGTYRGEAYDGVMRDLVANHVALVPEGRAGADVMVCDESPSYEGCDAAFDQIPCVTQKEHPAMALSRKALLAQGALTAYLRPRLAADANIDLVPILAQVTSANYVAKKPAIIAAVESLCKGRLGTGASLNGLATILGALDQMKVEETESRAKSPPNAKDQEKEKEEEEKEKAEDQEEEDDEEEKKKEAADQEKKDEEEEKAEDQPAKTAEGKFKARDKRAMDAYIGEQIAVAAKAATDKATRIQREIREAERAVRPYVGDLATAFDTAEDVYRTALTMLGVRGAKDIHASALKVLLEMQPKAGARAQVPASVAQDAARAADFNARFPGAARIEII